MANCEDCEVEVEVGERLCQACFDQWLQQATRGGR
jgi:dUTPase